MWQRQIVVIADFVLELVGAVFGWTPDGPRWLRRLVLAFYVALIGLCIAGLVVVLTLALVDAVSPSAPWRRVAGG